MNRTGIVRSVTRNKAHWGMSQAIPGKASSSTVWVSVLVGVGILAVLAVLGLYGLRRYLLAAMTSEVKESIGRIVASAASAYDRGNALCLSASRSVPASPTMIMGKKYQSSPAEWTFDSPDRGFACLKFSLQAPQSYMYSYRATGKDAAGDSFEAKGNGDLNGNGVLSEFMLDGRIVSPGVLQIAPLFKETRTNPEE